MPLYRINGVMVHVKMTNTKKRPAPEACREPITLNGARMRCYGMCTILCDWKENRVSCDKPVCKEHATEIGPDQHLCPEHAAMRAKQPVLF